MNNREIERHHWPLDEAYYIDIPARWIGADYFAYLDALKIAENERGVIQQFVISIAICDNYRLPGLEGKPEQWDRSQVDLQLMAWVSSVVFANFMDCFKVPKKKSSSTGERLAAQLMASTKQTLEATM